MRLAFVLLLVALAKVDASLKHTIESYVDNQPCMNDCVNNICRYNANDEGVCTPGNKVAHKYFTAQMKTGETTCLSRCGRFGKSYDWCYVSENWDWDYCSSKTSRKLVTYGYTMANGPCKDECAERGEKYYWCSTFWDSPSWDYCYAGYTDSYIQSWTTRGVECIGNCKRNENKAYNWCKTKNGWDYCAHPAISIHENVCPGSCSNTRVKRDDIDDWNCARRPGLLRDIAGYMESRPDLITVDVNETDNSVYRYTVRLPRTRNEPQIPVVVRARITPQTVAQPNSRTSDAIPSVVRTNLARMGMIRNQDENNNDEAGHLIAFMNGGPAQTYNFAPQTRRHNRGTNDLVNSGGSIWLTDEFEINQWVRAGGIVEQTVVVMYDDNWDITTRPAGFGTSIRYLNADRSLNRRCPDYFFSNNPSV